MAKKCGSEKPSEQWRLGAEDGGRTDLVRDEVSGVKDSE